MKKLTSLFLICFLLSSITFANQQKEELPQTYITPGLYVVVGVFTFEKNANRYTEYVNEQLGFAEVKYHPVKKFHYVYVGSDFASLDDAVVKLNEVRSQPEYDSAWVYRVKPYDFPMDQKIEVEVASQNDEEEVTNDEIENSELVLAAATSTGLTTSNDSELALKEANEISKEEEVIIPEGDKYYFNTFRDKNFEEIDGQIEVIDPTRVKTLGMRDAHKLVYIKSQNNTGDMQLICDIFGYKKIQHDFNIKSPVNEMTESFLEVKGDTLVIDFELKRYTKGDLVSMFNIFFYKDAAILKDESKYQLSQLTDLLEENDKYKIGIYGNTNGSAPGPIISLPKGSTDFFDLNAGKEGVGSAKKLSKERAEVIRQYLVSLGISEDRIKVKGNGGKKPLHDKYHNLAYRNMRVDVEILADK